MIVSWNGSLMDSDEVKISPGDTTLLRGEGVFETIRVLNGEPLYFSDHYRRLTSSAERLGVLTPQEDTLREALKEVVLNNNLREARVRVTLGENCLIMAEVLEPEQVGVEVSTLGKDYPVNERSPLVGMKCTSYAENMLLLRLGGTGEVLRSNTRGELCEGCVSNLFFEKDGKIYTPALVTGCLPGVMRQQVMKAIEVEEGCWPFEILKEVDGVWLSNSIRRLRFVSAIDGKLMGEPSELFHEVRSKLV